MVVSTPAGGLAQRALLGMAQVAPGLACCQASRKSRMEPCQRPSSPQPASSVQLERVQSNSCSLQRQTA